MIAEVEEYITGMDIVQRGVVEIGCTFWACGTTRWLHVQAVQVGKAFEEAHILVAAEVVVQSQYKIPGGDEVTQPETWLVMEGDNGSSQLAELIVTWQVITATPTTFAI